MEYQSGGSGSFDSQSTKKRYRRPRTPNEIQRSKKKRYRRPHTPNQLEKLEEVFKECPKPDEKQKLQLSKELALSYGQIRFWFQNKRVQTKAKLERNDNRSLRAENDKIRCENISMKEALENSICPSGGCPPINGDCYFDRKRLRLENALLKEELYKESSIISEYTGRSVLGFPPVPPIQISSLDSTMGSIGQGLVGNSFDIGEIHNNHSSLHCPTGKGKLFNLSSLPSSGLLLMNEQLPQQSWTPRYQSMQVDTFGNAMSHAQYSGQDSAIVPPHFDLDVQNHIFSGVNIDSSDLLPPTIDSSDLRLPIIDSSDLLLPTIDSSDLLLPTTIPGYTTSLGETGASTMQLGEFGFEGFDDPWESFLNSIWHNEILSPEDIQKMG